MSSRPLSSSEVVFRGGVPQASLRVTTIVARRPYGSGSEELTPKDAAVVAEGNTRPSPHCRGVLSHERDLGGVLHQLGIHPTDHLGDGVPAVVLPRERSGGVQFSVRERL